MLQGWASSVSPGATIGTTVYSPLNQVPSIPNASSFTGSIIFFAPCSAIFIRDPKFWNSSNTRQHGSRFRLRCDSSFDFFFPSFFSRQRTLLSGTSMHPSRSRTPKACHFLYLILVASLVHDEANALPRFIISRASGSSLTKAVEVCLLAAPAFVFFLYFMGNPILSGTKGLLKVVV